ncbi:class IV adenylate cyclase [Aureispira sp. CCB-QB1]|uniref:class IV adenylate cyclase n=1 Tax=Aureispira sp. CCB-QB1 TaxID=1313421 RepID=UPI000696DA8C|nr:class IV adenylate cyclase [Aureispira sp. CCB-QB1]
MAFDNIEIEIKIEVTEDVFHQTKQHLQEIATRKGTKQQLDRYFSTKQEGYLGSEKYPYKWLSIRERGDVKILNYKHYYPEGEEKHQYCDEFECEISNPKMLAKILSALGAEEIALVKKKRETFVFKDEFEIVLDQVDDLGFFIEVEAIKNQGGIEATRKKVENFINSINIGQYRTDYRGYPYLVFQKTKK